MAVRRRLSVDVLFRSVAHVAASSAAGIIIAGTGGAWADGIPGVLRAVTRGAIEARLPPDASFEETRYGA